MSALEEYNAITKPFSMNRTSDLMVRKDLADAMRDELLAEVERVRSLQGGPAMTDKPAPYRPSNGTEGELFQARYCYRCEKDADNDCEIIMRSMAFNTWEADYPSEWVYGEDGKPTCTAFKEDR